MQLVKLPFKEPQMDESQRGISISRFLKEQGLVMNRDFTWAVRPNERELHFYFAQDAESWATLLTMREL
jgi:hypothetical protein